MKLFGFHARAALAVTALLVTTVGCAPQTVRVEGVELLPSTTSTDWATYADYVIEVKVLSEARIAPTSEEVAAGEGLIGRTVQVSVSEVKWKRPTTEILAPVRMTWSAGGWAFKGGTEKKLVFADTPELQVGHHYLVAVAYTPVSVTGEGSSEWIPLGGKAMLPFDSGVVGEGETITEHDGGSYRGTSEDGASPMRDELWAASEAEVEWTLESMVPDSRANPYWHLNAVQRHQAVLRDSTPKQTPGPGEVE